MGMKQEQCCLVLFSHREEAERTIAGLHFTDQDHAIISIVRKPDHEDRTTLFIRLPRIGIVVCNGPFSQILQVRDLQKPFWEGRHNSEGKSVDGLAAALHEIGVPRSWHSAYEKALLHNRTLLVAYGPENRMRKICRSLSGTSAYDPVLYLH
jgi:hypothetical protein